MNKKFDKPMTLDQIAKISDDEINTSDIPVLDEAFWKNAKVSAARNKPNISLRVSEDVVAFFKAENPKGYTARMSAVLSAYVNAHQSK